MNKQSITQSVEELANILHYYFGYNQTGSGYSFNRNHYQITQSSSLKRTTQIHSKLVNALASISAGHSEVIAIYIIITQAKETDKEAKKTDQKAKEEQAKITKIYWSRNGDYSEKVNTIIHRVWTTLQELYKAQCNQDTKLESEIQKNLISYIYSLNTKRIIKRIHKWNKEIQEFIYFLKQTLDFKDTNDKEDERSNYYTILQDKDTLDKIITLLDKVLLLDDNRETPAIFKDKTADESIEQNSSKKTQKTKKASQSKNKNNQVNKENQLYNIIQEYIDYLQFAFKSQDVVLSWQYIYEQYIDKFDHHLPKKIFLIQRFLEKLFSIQNHFQNLLYIIQHYGSKYFEEKFIVHHAEYEISHPVCQFSVAEDSFTLGLQKVLSDTQVSAQSISPCIPWKDFIVKNYSELLVTKEGKQQKSDPFHIDLTSYFPHCECGLTTFLSAQKFIENQDEKCIIGISKLCCWLCQLFINIYNTIQDSRGKLSLQIEVQGCHNKIYSKWKFPNSLNKDLAAEIIPEMQTQIIHRILTHIESSGYSDEFESDSTAASPITQKSFISESSR